MVRPPTRPRKEGYYGFVRQNRSIMDGSDGPTGQDKGRAPQTVRTTERTRLLYNSEASTSTPRSASVRNPASNTGSPNVVPARYITHVVPPPPLNANTKPTDTSDGSAAMRLCYCLLFFFILPPVFYLGLTLGWQSDHPAAELDRISKARGVLVREQRDWEAKKLAHASLEEKIDKLRSEMASKRAFLAWEGMTAGNCLQWGVREYSAHLGNVRAGLDPLEECAMKQYYFPGVSSPRKPSRCVDTETCGKTTAFWNIESGEIGCQPYWKSFNKRDCKDGGKRAYHGQLENVEQANWHQVCRTTAAKINGKRYPQPDSCTDEWGHGTKWGIWFIDDSTCLPSPSPPPEFPSSPPPSRSNAPSKTHGAINMAKLILQVSALSIIVGILVA